ncbi:hypothetical protein PROFUN_17093, partial [Planoprotostelium fungivorum]
KRPAWAKALRATLSNWKKQLPEKLKLMERTAESVKDPLFRFFERETEKGVKLLSKVHRDIDDLSQICEGQLKPTNYTRELISNITKGVLPKSWKEYSIPSTISLNAWILDLSKRIKQLSTVGSQKGGNYIRGGIWIGGLFHPEAFITATRQAAAQGHGWSVENLTLTVEVVQSGSDEVSADGFLAKDLLLESAAFSHEKGCLVFTEQTGTRVPYSLFKWKNMDGRKQQKSKEELMMPVYLNENRAEFIFSVPMKQSLLGVYNKSDGRLGLVFPMIQQGVDIICKMAIEERSCLFYVSSVTSIEIHHFGGLLLTKSNNGESYNNCRKLHFSCNGGLRDSLYHQHLPDSDRTTMLMMLHPFDDRFLCGSKNAGAARRTRYNHSLNHCTSTEWHHSTDHIVAPGASSRQLIEFGFPSTMWSSNYAVDSLVSVSFPSLWSRVYLFGQ